MGDRLGSGIASNRRLITVATPSFEAFGKLTQGIQLYARSDHTGALELYRQALTLDPDFALAWMWKGHAFWSPGPRDSVEANYVEALRRPDRLTDGQRGGIEALLALHRNDLRTALTIYDRLMSQGSGHHHDRGLTLAYLGRPNEAVVAYRQALARQFAPSPLTLNNLLVQLLRSGRFDEARDISNQLDSLGHLWARPRALIFAALDRDWDRQERLGQELRDDPAAPADQQRTLQWRFRVSLWDRQNH